MIERFLDEIQSNLQSQPAFSKRLFHGRGKAFAGLDHLNIEWYPPFLFVQNFNETLAPEIADALKQLFENHPMIESVLIQSRQWPDFITQPLVSRAEPTLPIEKWNPLTEDLVCQVSLGKNRNTGVFLDMRAGWDWVKNHSENKRVLNLFSYTCIFSLFALQGGASRVDNVDMAANVLKIGQRNHNQNGLSDSRVAFYKRDIIKGGNWLKKRPKYDLIILDPPPYQKNAFRGWNDYKKLLLTCRNCLEANGQLFVCLNNPQATLNEFKQSLNELFPDNQSITALETAPEIKELDPEKGLKTVVVEF